MRICLVYDCLFPHTVGGAERWYRNLAEALAADGHQVTYLTLRQWERSAGARVPGVDVRSVGPRMRLYTESRRRVLPPVIFGLGVLAHLLVHGRRYDIVHTASFPYFSVLAAALARSVHRFGIVVDWHEVWSAEYWREYLGRAGVLGVFVQRLCARVRQRAFCFSRLHAARLSGEGLRGEVQVLEGEYRGPTARPDPEAAEAVVVFAGRHIPEKRIPALVRAMPVAQRRIEGLRCEIYGDGPERREVERLIAQLGLGESVTVHGFVAPEEVERAMSRALCLVQASSREGYGLVVIEAASKGVPSVVALAPDNAATELVVEGRNGYVAGSASPEDLAAAIERVHLAGAELRQRTADWFASNAERLSLASSLQTVLASYQEPTR